MVKIQFTSNGHLVFLGNMVGQNTAVEFDYMTDNKVRFLIETSMRCLTASIIGNCCIKLSDTRKIQHWDIDNF